MTDTTVVATSTRLTFDENGLHIVLEITPEQDVRLLHFSALRLDESTLGNPDGFGRFRLLEMQATGENQAALTGQLHIGTAPASRLKYVTHRDTRTDRGRKVELELADGGLTVIVHWQFYDGVPIVQAWTEARNGGDAPLGLEYLSSFALAGICKEGLLPAEERVRVHLPHNTWFGELHWQTYAPSQLGFFDSPGMKRFSYASTGSWPSEGYVPMGVVENVEAGTQLFWQIEASGSWNWEIASPQGGFTLHLSGPSEQENLWWKNLQPGETFVSVPVAVGSVAGSFAEAMGALTTYRRAMRRPNEDDEKLYVIFNDYMNCLFGDPTTEKLFPLIDAAAEAGCEIYCIDCGWYDENWWWSGVGEWKPAEKRFPNGITEPLNYVRAKGMIPGLWLELEVMGIECPLIGKVPEDWFFQRHGKPVIANCRYQLDYRNPEVRAHADEVIDRLVQEYGVGYIKMDYNINIGPGTEVDADSAGDGLLEHNRAYLDWLDSVWQRYPNLIIENCGSGGMRMTYGLLNRHSIQSSSDHTDYRNTAIIAAAGPSAVTPEQFAVWSYPLRDGDREEVIVNMVNALLLRIHQSGHLAEIAPERKALVHEGIAYYKSIRDDLKRGLPLWPLGLPTFGDGWASMGLRTGDAIHLAVWRLDGANATCALPIEGWQGAEVEVAVGYPQEHDATYQWHAASGTLTVTLPQGNTARLFKLTKV